MSFPLPNFSKEKITALAKRHRKCRAKLERFPNSKSAREEMISIFKEASKIIKELDSNNSPILREGANLGIEERSVLAIEEYRLQYDAPVWVDDTSEIIPKCHQDADKWPSIRVGPAISYVGNRVIIEPERDDYGTEPWKEPMKRHPLSSPLARFRSNLPAPASISSKPFLSSVQNALCEISSLQTASASYRENIELIKLQVSTSGVCLALLGNIGAKRRYPWLGYYLLNQEDSQSFILHGDKSFRAGLAETTSHMTIDESRKLVLVGDKTRVKSFAWGNSRRTFKRALPTHTLDSRRFEGPILTLPNGTILRNSLVGKRLDIDEYDEELDECAPIDESGGTPRASHIFFSDEPTLEPDLWERLPGSSAVVCAESYPDSEGSRSYLTIDFEYNGKTVTVFKGHRDAVSDFSTSAVDPRAFLTACRDGYARLFDMRQPYPVIEFKAGYQYDCRSVALAYLDHISIVFTGTDRREQIKVWDVRARACMYELATGNNRVCSLSWDAAGNSLFAYTSCDYKGKSRSYQYRQADIPRRRGASHHNNTSQDSKPRCWPRQAWRAEDYLEYAFDAGEDRVYRYAFKEEPDRYILPEYGNAKEDSYTIKRYSDEDYMGYGRNSDDEDYDEDDYDDY